MIKETKRILEVCCANMESVIAAKEGRADRIELCTALEVGGLTPSAGFIREAINVFGGNVMVLIRPRSGNYIYSAREVTIMERDIREASGLGAAGFVIGALGADGRIDAECCRRLMAAAPDKSFTFHRAFDCLGNPAAALGELIELGFDRVLTSGCAESAEIGIPVIRALAELGGKRISVMAGAGINSGNVRDIVRETGCGEVHASAKARKGFGAPSGSITSNCDTDYDVSSSEEIKLLKSLIK